ncbi:MAG: DUF7009 family protein [Chitinophagaceae bacterium]
MFYNLVNFVLILVMKIRIHHHKLIYRLKNEDIDFLKQNKYCKESLSIGDSSLLFC